MKKRIKRYILDNPEFVSGILVAAVAGGIIGVLREKNKHLVIQNVALKAYYNQTEALLDRGFTLEKNLQSGKRQAY